MAGGSACAPAISWHYETSHNTISIRTVRTATATGGVSTEEFVSHSSGVSRSHHIVREPGDVFLDLNDDIVEITKTIGEPTICYLPLAANQSG